MALTMTARYIIPHHQYGWVLMREYCGSALRDTRLEFEFEDGCTGVHFISPHVEYMERGRNDRSELLAHIFKMVCAEHLYELHPPIIDSEGGWASEAEWVMRQWAGADRYPIVYRLGFLPPTIKYGTVASV